MTPRVLLTLFIVSLFTFVASAERPPNFIIFFIDDLGYNDIGAYGSKLHRTPNIDRMAKEGRSFSNFYVTSGVCTPSRASLMTGCYPKRISMHESEKGQWVLFPGNKRGLNSEEITLPEILKDQGYTTGIIGKWHLGDQPNFFPLKHGFDSYFGIPYSNDMGMMNGAGKIIRNRNYPPLPLIRDNDIIELEPDQRLITQKYTAEVKTWIRQHKDEPFFLYFPHSMPHAPQFSSENFDGKSANGKWGDAVEEIDWSVGEVLKELKNQRIDDNTMVVFLSDNGGAMSWGASNTPLRGGKGTTLEGGQRVPFIVRYPGHVPANSQASQLATSMDLLPTIAKLAGGKAPTDRITDGKDIWPLISGDDEAKSPHRAFYYYYRGELQAVRSGNWKLHVARTVNRRGKITHHPLQLFNLKRDIGEANNVAQANPKVVKRLEGLLAKARKDLGDDHPDHKSEGKNTRIAGHVENAIILHGKPD